MSAFLGPIHYWLYNKIKLQHEIVEEIFQIGEKHGLSLREECTQAYGSLENKPLEEMIDLSNIHGWLQDKVSLVEYRYAYSITKLLKEKPETIDEIKQILSNKGKKLAETLANQEPNAQKIYQVISDNLLDGMPCDHAYSILSQGENDITLRRNQCVHQNYWDEVGGQIEVYYELRDAWINGLVNEFGFIYKKLDDTTLNISKEV